MTSDDSREAAGRVQCGMKWLVVTIIGAPILLGFLIIAYVECVK